MICELRIIVADAGVENGVFGRDVYKYVGIQDVIVHTLVHAL